jgi:cell wall-associated NlpC family hydrolase
VTTGADLVAAAEAFLGQPYSTNPGRDDPTSGHKDCSGLIAASYLAATGQPLGANVSVSIFDLCANQGLEIPYGDAVGIAGACLLIPENPYQGWGSNGHIGFADGQGGTVEATPPRVQRLPIRFQPWGRRACLLPGIDYGFGPPAITLQEDDVLFRATTNSADGAVLAGVIYASASTRFLRIDAPPANAVICDVPGDDLAAVRAEMLAVNQAAQAALGRLPAQPCPPSLTDASSDDLLEALARRL